MCHKVTFPFNVFQLGGDPVQVAINLDVKAMGPVDENSMSFSLDAYFRQSWFDRRLQYNATGEDNSDLVIYLLLLQRAGLT